MFKNIFISFLVCILSLGLSFAEEPLVDLASEADIGLDLPSEYYQEIDEIEQNYAQEDLNNSAALGDYNESVANQQYIEDSQQFHEEECAESKACIDQPTFEIKVDNISPGMKVQGDTVKESVNFALGTIIQKLMIALGSFALLVMTIGAGYIILNNGQDEILNKGKSIFMSGVYSLVIALSSYYLIAIVRFILF